MRGDDLMPECVWMCCCWALPKPRPNRNAVALSDVALAFEFDPRPPKPWLDLVSQINSGCVMRGPGGTELVGVVRLLPHKPMSRASDIVLLKQP